MVANLANLHVYFADYYGFVIDLGKHKYLLMKYKIVGLVNVRGE